MLSKKSLLHSIIEDGYWRNAAKDLFYFYETDAPSNVIKSYIFAYFKNSQITKIFLPDKYRFRKETLSLTVSHDWFTRHIPFWLSVFSEYGLANKDELLVLEIGSWEGLSSYFILDKLPNARLTCVDPWSGSYEHKIGGLATVEEVKNSEMLFDLNLEKYQDRLLKYKGSSLLFFTEPFPPKLFNLIYVDGSHHCDDVMIDLIKCFEMLAPRGIMIMDDYFWRELPIAGENPAAAINAFLRLKKGQYKIIRIYYQLIIEKIVLNEVVN